MEGKLMEVLHSDNLQELISVIKLSNLPSNSQLLGHRLHSRTDDEEDAAPAPSLQFFQQHSAVIEAAFCALAVNCCEHLIDAGGTEQVLLDDDSGRQLRPLHCLILRLTAADSPSLTLQAIDFLERLETSRPDFTRACLDAELTGYNALEFAVLNSQWRLAEWVLQSGRYARVTAAAGGAKVRVLDVSEYLAPLGPRVIISPVGILAAERVDLSKRIPDELKSFLDSPLMRMWTQSCSERYRSFFALKAVTSLVMLVWFSFFCLCAGYKALYLKQGAMRMTEMMDNHSSDCSQLHYVFYSVSNWYVNAVLGYLIIGLWFMKSLLETGCLSLYICTFWGRRKLPGGYLYLSPIIIALISILIGVGYVNRQGNDGMQLGVGREAFFRFERENFASLTTFDHVSFIISVCMTMKLLHECSLVIDKFCLTLNCLQTFAFFILMIALLICYASWLTVAMVPCETSLGSSSDTSLVSLWVRFYAVLASNSFSPSSLRRLGTVYMMLHVMIVLFCFNFLVAILSDRISTVSNDLQYVALINRLREATLFDVIRARLARLNAHWGPLWSARKVTDSTKCQGGDKGGILTALC